MKSEGTIPEVTILMITRNRAKLLGRSIESALNQTYKNFELLIIDGDSEDNSREIIENYAKNDNRVKYIWYQNEIPQKCFNYGLTICKGEYIAILDDDDEIFPTKIEKQVNLMKHSGEKLGVVYCWEEYWDDKEDKKIKELKNANRGDVYELLLAGPGTGGGTQMLIRKSALLKVGGYDTTIKAPSDLQLRLNIAEFYEFDFVPEILIRTHVNHIYQRLTGNLGNDSVIELHKKMLDDHKKAYKKYPEKQLWQLKAILGAGIVNRKIGAIFFAFYRVIILSIPFIQKTKILFELFLLLIKKITKSVFV